MEDTNENEPKKKIICRASWGGGQKRSKYNRAMRQQQWPDNGARNRKKITTPETTHPPFERLPSAKIKQRRMLKEKSQGQIRVKGVFFKTAWEGRERKGKTRDKTSPKKKKSFN